MDDDAAMEALAIVLRQTTMTEIVENVMPKLCTTLVDRTLFVQAIKKHLINSFRDVGDINLTKDMNRFNAMIRQAVKLTEQLNKMQKVRSETSTGGKKSRSA